MMLSRICLALSLSFLFLTALSADEAGPLTNVDIVRMAAARVSEKEIIRTIREADSTTFDLESDMVVELRRAGVSQAIIDVMLEVQPQIRPEQPDPESTDVVNLEVRFPDRDPENPASNTASLPGVADETNQNSILFYVACLAPTHVPDLWQTKTPMTTRFQRHKLIGVIEENITESDKKKKNVKVHLVLPETTLMEIPAGPHQLEVGLAGKVDEEGWFPLASAEGILDAQMGVPALLEIKISTRGLKWLGRKSANTPLHTVEIVTLTPTFEPEEP